MSTRQNNGKGRGIGKFSMEVRKMWKKVGLALVAVGLCLTLILGAAISVCEARPAREIVVGVRGSWTGALVDAVGPYASGTLDYFRYLNETQGGINGVPIKAMWYDNHSETTKDIFAHKRFVAAGAVLEYSYVAPGTWATLPLQERDEIPLFGNNIAEGMNTTPQWVWASVPPWNCMHASFISWAKENWAEERPPRFGYVAYNDPAAIFEGREGISEFCNKIGVEWVGHEVVPILTIDTSTELLRLAAKKPDWVYVHSYASPLVVIIKDAARLGLREEGIRFCSTAQAIDEIVVNTTGAAAAEGWYTLRVLPSPWEEGFLGGIKAPEMAVEREYIKKYRGLEPEEQSEWFPCGWGVAKIGAEGIRRALENVGIENLTGRAVRDAIFSTKDFDTGMLSHLVTLTDDKPYFVDDMLLYQVRQGKIVPVVPPTPYILPSELGVRL